MSELLCSVCWDKYDDCSCPAKDLAKALMQLEELQRQIPIGPVRQLEHSQDRCKIPYDE